MRGRYAPGRSVALSAPREPVQWQYDHEVQHGRIGETGAAPTKMLDRKEHSGQPTVLAKPAKQRDAWLSRCVRRDHTGRPSVANAAS